MALPIKEQLAAQAVQQCMQKARLLRDNATTWRAAANAGGISGDQIINAALGIKQYRDMLAAYAAVPGFDAAAKEEYADANMTLSAEVATVVAACDNTLSWINANYPKDGSGYLLDRQIVNGAIVFRTFTKAAMAGLVTQLDALIGTFS